MEDAPQIFPINLLDSKVNRIPCGKMSFLSSLYLEWEINDLLMKAQHLKKCPFLWELLYFLLETRKYVPKNHDVVFDVKSIV